MEKQAAIKLLEEKQMILQLPFQTVEIARFDIENDAYPREAILYGNIAMQNEQGNIDAEYYCVAYFVRVLECFWYCRSFRDAAPIIDALRTINNYEGE